MNTENKSQIVVGLAYCAGLGLTVMMVALAAGVISGDASNTTALGLLFAAGLLMLIGGVGGWLGVVRPFTHFDDINIPAEEEHHNGDQHDQYAVVEHKAY